MPKASVSTPFIPIGALASITIRFSEEPFFFSPDSSFLSMVHRITLSTAATLEWRRRSHGKGVRRPSAAYCCVLLKVFEGCFCPVCLHELKEAYPTEQRDHCV